MSLLVILFLLAYLAEAHASKSIFFQVAKLNTLAQNSALQAQNLLWNQQLTTKHADFLEKTKLAQAALDKASAAFAALAAKKLEVDLLEKRLKAAEEILKDELSQYEQLKQVSETFTQAAENSKKEAGTLRGILEGVKNTPYKDFESNAHISFGNGFH